MNGGGESDGVEETGVVLQNPRIVFRDAVLLIIGRRTDFGGRRRDRRESGCRRKGSSIRDSDECVSFFSGGRGDCFDVVRQHSGSGFSGLRDWTFGVAAAGIFIRTTRHFSGDAGLLLLYLILPAQLPLRQDDWTLVLVVQCQVVDAGGIVTALLTGISADP